METHPQSDHDLLVRIDERLNSVNERLNSAMGDLSAERFESIGRSAKHELDLKAEIKDRVAEIDKLRAELKSQDDKRAAEIEKLNMSKAQIMGGALTISTVVSGLIVRFWK